MVLPQVLVEDEDDLVDLLLAGTMFNCVGNARVHMLAEDSNVGFFQQGGGRQDLLGDVNAVAVLLDHADDAVDLAPGSLERVKSLFAVTRTVIHDVLLDEIVTPSLHPSTKRLDSRLRREHPS